MTGKTETVNHPAHYTALAGIEPIDIAKFCDFCTGNVIKYVLRAPFKGSLVDDLKKAAWYAGYLSEHPGTWFVQFEPVNYFGFRCAESVCEEFKNIYQSLQALGSSEFWTEWGEAYLRAPDFGGKGFGANQIGLWAARDAAESAIRMLIVDPAAVPSSGYDTEEGTGDLDIVTAYLRRAAGALDFAAVHAEVSVRGAADAVEP